MRAPWYSSLEILVAPGLFAGSIIFLTGSAVHWLDALEIWTVWAPAFGVLLFGLSIADHVRSSREVSRPYDFSSFAFWYITSLTAATLGAILAFSAIALVRGVQLLLPGLASVTEWMQRLPAKPWVIATTALVTGIVGGGFFIFRLRQRFLYGATEALAGTVIAAHRISVEPGTGLPSETGFYVAVLTAGVYLVVRGLDNMHQAVEGGDPFAKWFLAKARWSASWLSRRG